jgi:hypothetical protein
MIRRLARPLAALGLLLAPALALADPSVTPVLIYDQVNHAPAGTNANPIFVTGSTGGTGGITGNVASGATDSGNPVKVGSVYNSSVPTFTTGQRADIQSNQHGSLYVQLTDNFTQPVAATVLNVDANVATAIALEQRWLQLRLRPNRSDLGSSARQHHRSRHHRRRGSSLPLVASRRHPVASSTPPPPSP